MTDPDFDEIGRMLAEEGTSGFDSLADRFIASGNFPAAFEARLIKKRFEMGLPLMAASQGELSPDASKVYAEAQIAAAREVGLLFLGRGDIRRAWPYFRAIGEVEPVRAVIENFQPGEDGNLTDGAIEVGLYEAVHPAKGIELLLQRHGICRAITTFGQYPSEKGREQAGGLIVRSVYDELRTNIRSTIQAEGYEAPSEASLLELIDSRSDLFDENAHYIDTSHVISVLRFAIDFESRETLQMAYELTEYGRRLGEMYQFKGQSPFENPFLDYGAYLQALLGNDVETALDRFRSKLSIEPEPFGDITAQTLVNLLVRLDRFEEAINISEERLSGIAADHLICPGVLELCERAGDLDRLKTIAQKTGNLIAYAAAVVSLAKA